MKAKILMITSNTYLAGSEKIVYALADYFKHIFQIWVLCLNKGPLSSQLKRAKINHVVIPRRGLSSLKMFHNFIKELEPDIVHFHSARTMVNFLPNLNKKHFLLLTKHGFEDKLALSIQKYWHLYWDRKFDYIVVVSKWMKKELSRLNIFYHKKIIVIENGIMLNGIFFNKAKQNFNVGFVGRISAEKNIFDLLKVARNLKRKDICFLIAGEGPLSAKMLKFKSKYNLFNLIFLGWQYNLKDFYQKIDVLINCSLQEGLSLSLLEAMSYGCAIIASDIPANKELIIPRYNGLLYRRKDIHDLAEKILLLRNNRELRLFLAYNARKTVEQNYDIKYMFDKYHSLYRRLLNAI